MSADTLRIQQGESPATVSPVVGDGALGDAVAERLAAQGWQSRRLADAPRNFASTGTLILVPERHRPALDPWVDLARRYADTASEGQPEDRPTRHLILVSSAEIHEPSHRHPGHWHSESPRNRKPTNAIARRWLDLESRVRGVLEGRELALTILRPTALPVDGGTDLWSRLFQGSWAVVPAGFDPSVQLLSVDEFVDAIAQEINKSPGSKRCHPLLETAPEIDKRPGPKRCHPLLETVRHIAPQRGVIPSKQALRRAGIRRLALPATVLRPLWRMAGRDADEIDYLRYPWTVSPWEGSDGETADGPIPDPSTVEHDPFGMDKPYIARLGRTLFRFLHNVYWRIEWRGLEHIPTEGPAVLVGPHRGHQPWDGVMILHRLASTLGRYPRFLIHPTLAKHPHLTPYMIRCGGVHACQANGDWVLRHREILAIFPEGIRGAFAHYRDAYRLRKFGRNEFVKFALRHRAPIVPFVIVGSAEIFPIFGNVRWPWWQRVSEWPFFPITPTMSLLPLPSKWHALVLEPIPTEDYGPEAADDPAIVNALSLEVRRRMEEAWGSMLERRRHIFFGSIFEDSNPEDLEGTTTRDAFSEAPVVRAPLEETWP